MGRNIGGWIVDQSKRISDWSARKFTYAAVVAVFSIATFLTMPAVLLSAYHDSLAWFWSALNIVAFGVGTASFVVSVSISAKQLEESSAREADRDALLIQIRSAARSAAVDAGAARLATENALSTFERHFKEAERARGSTRKHSNSELKKLAMETFSVGLGESLEAAPRILWVDDHPNGNVFERRALESAGVIAEISLSTEDALARLASDRYHLVISDMERFDNSRAGYELLTSMRAEGFAQPFVIYAGDARPEFLEETLSLGGDANTNDPFVLLEEVSRLLSDTPGD